MSNNIKEIIAARDAVGFATAAGTDMHNRLGRIMIGDEVECGDVDLIAKIKANPQLAKMFCPKSMTEVPVAGIVSNRFISRRIDRLYIDDETKTVYILDYKTDVSRDLFHDKYVSQLREYSILLRQVYPKHTCKCFILWTHDWVLESL